MKEQGNKQFWSRWSGFYDRFMHSNERLYDAITAKMKGSLNRQMNVLELACGTGLISGQIVGSVKSIEATDFSPEMIAEAKKKPHSARLHYSVQDATNLPYGSETFDAVVITNALHIMPEDTSEAAQNPLADFQPVMRRTRKPGTGCITEINDHLFEGRYSPTWPDGTKHSKCVYAHTREECEQKLKVLIQQLNAERKTILDRLRGIPSPEKLTKKQRQIWEYMKVYPDETNYSTIAKGARVTRHTVAKHYEVIRGMVER